MPLEFLKELAVTLKLPMNHKHEDSFFEDGKICSFQKIKVHEFRNINLSYIGLLFKGLSIEKHIDHSLIGFKPRNKWFYLSFLLSNYLKKSKTLLPLDQEYVYFFDDNSVGGGYYHFLLETLPRYFSVKEWIGDRTIVLPSVVSGYNIDIFNEIFAKHKTISSEPNQYLRVPHLFLVNHTATKSNHHPEAIEKTRKGLLELINNRLSPIQNDKIYLSRQKANKRKVSNNTELVAFLTDQGITEVFLEDYSFLDQLALFYHTKLLIAIHGAGMSNMLMMQKKSICVEFRNINQKQFGLSYYKLANVLGIEYNYLKCYSNSTDYMVGDLEVSISELAELIFKHPNSNT